LPKWDGWQVARRPLALSGLSAINLMAVTSLTGKGGRRRADEAGFAFFLVKPFDPPALEGPRRQLAERRPIQAAGAEFSSLPA
jgi:CheY-like chemotaxis protein